MLSKPVGTAILTGQFLRINRSTGDPVLQRIQLESCRRAAGNTDEMAGNGRTATSYLAGHRLLAGAHAVKKISPMIIAPMQTDFSVAQQFLLRLQILAFNADPVSLTGFLSDDFFVQSEFKSTAIDTNNAVTPEEFHAVTVDLFDGNNTRVGQFTAA